jgi:DNA-binding transcriptional regulator LsrR (DeoR family)
MLSSAPSALWNQCQRAFFGIGPVHGSIYETTESLTREQIRSLEAAGAVGDVVGHYVGLEGELIRSPIEDRIVTIPVSVLRKVPEKTAVAGGKEKKEALKGTLRSGLIDVLITDETTAKAILE